MIWDAEKRGVLDLSNWLNRPAAPGIALAYVAAARGDKLTLTMPVNHEHRTPASC
ncbi:hypothetical protein ACNKHO_15255 [Shigella flexneri]